MSDECCEIPAPSPAAKLGCPGCGLPGKAVLFATVKSMLRGQELRTLNVDDPFSFCSTAGCPTVYFSGSQSFQGGALRVAVFQKEAGPDAPVCYCFEYARKDFEDPAEATAATEAIKDAVKKGVCACETRSPQGSCCLGNIAGLMGQG